MAIVTDQAYPMKQVTIGGKTFAYADTDQVNATVDAAFARAQKLPAAQLRGQVIRFSVADGYAVYRIDRLRPLTLCCLTPEYRADRRLLLALTLADVRTQVSAERALAKLFHA